jgi:D-psicose/D-tagatose/L-ribulose 3-epimerase
VRTPVAAMQRLADYAGDKGININLEVVNRYESNIMNTGIEGLAFLDEVNVLTLSYTLIPIT